MTYVISFISQKGGVGKSTLARATAQELKKGGFKVKLADLDVQQGTSQDWHRRRLMNDLEPVGSVELFRTIQEAIKESQNFDAIVIDGAGRSSEATKQIAELSNIVVQPSGPGLDDLQPAIKLNHELVKHGIPMDRLWIALSRVGTATEEDIARDYIAQAGYKALDGATYERTAYRLAMNGGQTITETNYEGLNTRADTLVQSIFNQLEEQYGDTQKEA